MSHTYNETTRRKYRDSVKVKRAFRNHGELEELPSRESLHRVSPHSWDEDASVTLYNRLETFLAAHVGQSADATYSEFLHAFCTGLSSRWVDVAKDIYKNLFLTDVERALHSPWRRDFYVGDAGKLQMRVPSHKHIFDASKITLIPVPKSKWANTALPEVWEQINHVWFRWTTTPVDNSYLLDTTKTPFARTGWDKNFVHMSLAHKRSCSKCEIQQEILPEVRRRNLLQFLD